MTRPGELLAQPCAAPRVSNRVSATDEAPTRDADRRAEQAGPGSTRADGPRSADPNPAWQRVLSRCDYDEATGCLLWSGSLDGSGYGRVKIGGTTHLTHRVVYSGLVGLIPDGLHVGHRCHDVAVEVGTCAGGDSCQHRRCVLPSHLEVQTQRVNTLAGLSPAARHARATACPADHPYDGANLYVKPSGGRICRTCRNAHKVASLLRARQTAPTAIWQQVDLLEAIP